MHVIACGGQFICVGSHGGQEQDDLLLVMFLIRAETVVFGNEDTLLFGPRQVLRREQLVAEYQQH